MTLKRQQARARKRKLAKLREHIVDKKTDEIKRVIETYVELCRPIMLDHGWKVNSCIAATRVTINVLSAYGIPARPFCVIGCVYNAAWVRLRDKLGRPPTIDEQRATDGNGDAWSVGLGAPREPGDPPIGEKDYNGHLVALVGAQDAILIDASIDQASRPHKNMTIAGAAMAETSPEFIEGRSIVVGQNSAGVVVVYEKRHDPPDWTDAKDWGMYYHSDVELAILKAMIAKGVAP